MTIDEARTRVAKGAALLDERIPGWAHLIDLGRLDMHKGCLCVLGQLYRGGFWAGAKQFGYDFDNKKSAVLAATAAAEHGFHTGLVCHVEEDDISAEEREIYRVLQDAWVEAIAARVVTKAAPQTAAVL